MKFKFLHIPKNGGTALKYAIEGMANPPYEILAHAGHNPTLQTAPHGVFFQIRDPWQRFCSAFWERKTVYARRDWSNKLGKTSFGYAIPSALEQKFLDRFDSPDELCTHLREGHRMIGILEELASPHSRWLGNIKLYKHHEHKVGLVYHTQDQDAALQTLFGISGPQDAFSRRSRSLFDRPQSYTCSPENFDWFTNQYRKDEYELLAYISVQEYYWRP